MFDFDIYCLPNEKWKDIPDYEGIYKASTLGRIRTVDNKITQSTRHGTRMWRGRILKNKTKIPDKSGYKVTLWKNKKAIDYLVARLVCATFYGKNDNMTVNHKNGNRFDNRIDNLEWLSLANNVKHAFNNDLAYQEKITLKNNGNIFQFRSMAQASIFLKRNKGYVSGRLKENKDIKDINGEVYEVVVKEAQRQC